MYAFGPRNGIFARPFQFVHRDTGLLGRAEDTDDVDDDVSSSPPSTDSTGGLTTERALDSLDTPSIPSSVTSPPRAPSALSSRTAVSDDPDYCDRPCRHHPSKDLLLRNQTPHAPNLNRFIREAFRSLKRLYPRTRGTYNVYDKAHILFIRWQDDDLNTYQEIADLKRVLSKLHVTAMPTTPEDLTSEFLIPSHDEYKDSLEECLQMKKFAYTAKATDLLVVYYGGHARMDANQDCIWYPSIKPPAGCSETPQINWSKLQDMFKDREGDVVFILDCCYAGAAISASRAEWIGFKELFAACGKLEETEGVNDNSFTAALIRQLEALQANGQSTSIRGLATALTRGQISRNLKHSPIAFALSPRAEQGESWRLSFAQPTAPEIASAPTRPADSGLETDETRVLISIRLHDPAVRPDMHNWSRWLKTLAPDDIANIEMGWTDSWADYVRLEGIFDHGSKLLLVSLPAELYKLMAPDPTCNLVDTVLSANQLVRPSSPEGKQSDPMEAVAVTPNFGPAVQSDDVWSVDETLVGSLGIPFNAPRESTEQDSNAATELVARQIDDVLDYSVEKFAGVQEFTYHRLFDPQQMCRLIRLMPSTFQNPQVYCEIVHAKYDENGVLFETDDTSEPGTLASSSELMRLDYEAVSWSWGAHSLPTALLMVIRDGEVYKMPVSREVELLLKHLRSSLQNRLLWIDAVCINMYNIEERNNQVSLISRIFFGARKTCIWLGAADVDSTIAIPFVKDEMMSWHNKDSQSNPLDRVKWTAFFNFMQRTWFSRRWVVQEIALAREAVIYCGRDHLHWKDFAAAVELSTQAWHPSGHMFETLKSNSSFKTLLQIFEISSELPASQLVQVTSRLYRLREMMAMSSELEAFINPGIEANKPSLLTNQPRSHISWFSSVPYILRQPLLSLEFLVSNLYMFEHSEPRDAVYSMLALANDVTAFPKSPYLEYKIMSQFGQMFSKFGPLKPYLVDYLQPYDEFCKDFVSFCIESNCESMSLQSIDIICRPWASHPPVDGNKLNRIARDLDVVSQSKFQLSRYSQHEEKVQMLLEEGPQIIPLPSWVCTVSCAPFAKYAHPGLHVMKLGRKNADSLVGMPGGQNKYNASRRVADFSSIKFRKRSALGHHSLYARGFVVDEVVEVGHPSQAGSIPHQWFQMAKWNDIGQDPPDELWRTLVADRGLYSHNAPYYYRRACKEATEIGGLIGGALNTTDLINSGQSTIVAEFCRRVQEVVWNRCLLRTKLGYLGLAKGARTGDLICILYGCTVPLILRRSEHKSSRELEEEVLVDGMQALKAVCKRWIQKSRLRWERRAKIERMSKDAREALTRDTAHINTKLQNIKRLTRSQEESLKSPVFQRFKGIAEDKHYYTLIGETYIHGIMEGEAQMIKNSFSIPDKLLEIR